MEEWPRKVLIKDLFSLPVSSPVWIQGTIEQTVGTDILILCDTSGRAKITKCDTADGTVDKKSIRKGAYCCILGNISSLKGIPEVAASKFIDLSGKAHMKLCWLAEVNEAKLCIEGKLQPI